MNGTAIVWFRKDLRVADNPALSAAVEQYKTVIPVYILSDEDEQPWPLGGAQRWWVHHSLCALKGRLETIALPFLVYRRRYAEALQHLIEYTGAAAVFVNKRYEPHAATVDRQVFGGLEEAGIRVQEFEGTLLHDPDSVQTRAGGPYRVFTPFWKKLQQSLLVQSPLPSPEPTRGEVPRDVLDSLGEMSIDDLQLLPVVNWATGIANAWEPGEVSGLEHLNRFAVERLQEYETGRDQPAVEFTSRLSPYLAHGELSARQIWHRVTGSASFDGVPEVAMPYLRQLCWREFSYHVLHHNPETSTEPLNKRFAEFPWEKTRRLIGRWEGGKTGYPIVDAGMRELWTTGFMHNRVRMIVASFLTKHLLIHWRYGAAWFWDTLIDADLANNTMGWQWSAGSGADAQPYFRIFNPITQGKKFDADGAYVRRWVPELSELPNRFLHSPWEAPQSVLDSAGVELGKTYPPPVVDHSVARARALAAYDIVKS